MTVIQTILDETAPPTALRIARLTGLAIEAVYRQLAKLEAQGRAHPINLRGRFPAWTKAGA